MPHEENGLLDHHNQLLKILPKLFGKLSSDELEAIIGWADGVHIKQGEELFRQDEAGDSFYILLSGSLSAAAKDRNGVQHIVGGIKAGEIVGEMALLSDEKRSAAVFANRDSYAVKFSKAEFSALLKKYPGLMMRVTKLIVDRLRVSIGSEEEEEECTVMAVVPLSPDTRLREFLDPLLKELSAGDSLLHLNSKKLDSRMGTPGIAQCHGEHPDSMRISAWVTRQETKHRFIIYEADPKASNWTKRCISQSDQVLLVGNAWDNPGLSEIESKFIYTGKNKNPTRQRLVLLHPGDSKLPTGTDRWLKTRKVEMHFHTRLGSYKDIRRMSRMLSGKTVGIALGGGGARGFSQVGAIRALEEAGIPIDLIGGTSMGAFIAAGYAYGWDPAALEQVIKKTFKKGALLRDVTLPMVSLSSGRALTRGIKKCFGDTKIEDLWLPYFCVSSNITHAEKEVHRRGYLWQAIRASGGLQGFFPPFVLDGDLHVDGAMFANLPVDIMKIFCKGRVIGIDVSPPVDLGENTSYGDSLSGWRILWKKLNPFAKPIRMPGIGTILQRAGEISSIAHHKDVIESKTDFYLSMPVEEYGLLDFKSASKIIAAGYEHAKKEIDKFLGGDRSLESKQIYVPWWLK
ncbi:MAG: patatin-like phospholipase family protein [Candidatus Aminicenantes bacterium]|nr:patatin-like phospholipase family protein [Candidatus Aminicenantes bacterium]